MKNTITLSLVLFILVGCTAPKIPKKTYDSAPRGMISVYDAKTGQKRNMTKAEYNDIRSANANAAHKNRILLSLGVGILVTALAANNGWFPGQTDRD